jgi:hypothetical protein
MAPALFEKIINNIFSCSSPTPITLGGTLTSSSEAECGREVTCGGSHGCVDLGVEDGGTQAREARAAPAPGVVVRQWD